MDETKYRLLSSIKYPSDLRQLGVEQLPQLCAELRGFIVDELSTNPGHLASSLGAVELTVALHYVFDTPNDRIVWDVGHQAYGHKILTGRREQFCSNRKLHGLRPFPSPEESEYDTFTCGHASNSISAALGMAVAEKLKGGNDDDSAQSCKTVVIGYCIFHRKAARPNLLISQVENLIVRQGDLCSCHIVSLVVGKGLLIIS